MTNKLTTEHLQRRAIVYVRQSTLIQVVQNRESQLRQYNLVAYAREGLTHGRRSERGRKSCGRVRRTKQRSMRTRNTKVKPD